MDSTGYDEIWEEIQKCVMPCKVIMLCTKKKTYTGPGIEYTPLWSVTNENIPILLMEVKWGKNHVLWGRLWNGMGWIDLKEVCLCK